MISYEDLCILKLTGILEPYNKKEFIIPNEMIKEGWGDFFTCEFLKGSKYIIRNRCDDGHKLWEREYKNGQSHGKYIEYGENGNKCLEIEYKNGKRHGKSIWWYKNGNKRWEYEFKNGKLVRKIL